MFDEAGQLKLLIDRIRFKNPSAVVVLYRNEDGVAKQWLAVKDDKKIEIISAESGESVRTFGANTLTHPYGQISTSFSRTYL